MREKGRDSERMRNIVTDKERHTDRQTKERE